jgi:arabinogalactan oligomer/maltooligosaccharide transport system substrate-binding protein
MKSKRISIAIIISALAFLALNSTNVQAKPQVTEISFWYTENDTEKRGVIALIEEFELNNPDIDVEALQKGFFDARALYTNAFIAATEPELFRAARDWVPEFAVAGMIAPITDEIQDNMTEFNDFLPSAIRLVTYPDDEGTEQIWGYPQLVDTPALMYNKEIFRQAGIDVDSLSINTSWTWEEFVGNATVIVNNTDLYAYTIQGMFTGAHASYFGRGARLFEDGIVDINHIAIDSAKTREALSFLKNMIETVVNDDNDTITPPWEEMGWETINVLFADDGEVAMIQQGPWELKNFLDNSPEFNSKVTGAKGYASPDNLGIMQLPHDDEGNQGAPLGGHAYVVSAFAGGDKYDAAIRLAEFLTGADAMAEGLIDYYHVPARTSVMERTDVKDSDSYEYVLGFKKNVDNAYQVPVSHHWARLEQEFADNIDEYLANDISLDDCIAQTVTIWKEVLTQSIVGVPTTDTKTSEEQQLTEETPGFGFIIALTPVVLFNVLKRRKKRH